MTEFDKLNHVRVKIDNLINEFVSGQKEDESDEEMSKALLDFILQRERIRRGAADANVEIKNRIDAETLKALKNCDLDDPSYALQEKIFRKMGVDPTSAIKMLGIAIDQRKKLFSKQQQLKARKLRPNKRKVFSSLIDEIVRENPKISQNQVLNKLKKVVEITVDLADGKITHDESRDEMFISSVSSMLSRSKKRMLKN